MVSNGDRSASAAAAAEAYVERRRSGGRRRADESSDEDEGSQCFSDAEDRSWHSRSHSRHDSVYEDYISPCTSVRSGAGDADGEGASASAELGSKSCVSECSAEAVDLEAGLAEIVKGSPEKAERNCRICHLGLESAAPESGAGIVLGCSCKDDLSCAHEQCAETWFKIRGNKICEICGSTACNVVGFGDGKFIEQWNESNSTAAAQGPPAETRRFWQGHRFLNFLLACMVFAFVISWLFHFNVPG